MPTCVMVPGFAGSELRIPLFFGLAKKTIWLCYHTLAFGGWERLRLAADGIGPFPSFATPLIADQSVEKYYSTLNNYLRGKGWSVLEARSDWRKPLAVSAPALAALIESAGAAGPVTLVCHSRGGLLAAAALRLMEARGSLSAVKRGVSLGTPWGGSYEPLPFLAGWADSVVLIERIILATGLISPLLALRQVREVVISWPGLYELLPDPSQGVAAHDPIISNVYTSSLWSSAGVPVSARHLAAAQGRWAAPATLPGSVEWTAVYGEGFATNGPLRAGGSFGDRSALGGGIDGDGVVPTWSALAAGRQAVPIGVGHVELVTEASALALLASLISR